MKVKQGIGILPILTLKTPVEQSDLIMNDLVKRLSEEGIRAGIASVMPEAGYDTAAASFSHDLVIVASANDLVPVSSSFVESGLPAADAFANAVFSCGHTEGVGSGLPKIMDWLRSCMNRTPLLGCVLIGGKSSRMGRPKHLLTTSDGSSWLEKTIARLKPHVGEVVISGTGEIPGELAGVTRIEDLPGVHGPMAGVGSVLEKYPASSCVVVACDMPDLGEKGIGWLLSMRRPGRIAVIPKNRSTGHIEPLFAWYDFRCRPYFRDFIASERFGMHEICRCQGVYQPEIPAEISEEWRNVNYPRELAKKAGD